MSPIRVSQVPKLKSDFHRARSAQTHNKRSRIVGKKLGGSLVTTEASREETWTFLQDRCMAWLVCYQLAGLHLSSFLLIFFYRNSIITLNIIITGGFLRIPLIFTSRYALGTLERKTPHPKNLKKKRQKTDLVYKSFQTSLPLCAHFLQVFVPTPYPQSPEMSQARGELQTRGSWLTCKGSSPSFQALQSLCSYMSDWYPGLYCYELISKVQFQHINRAACFQMPSFRECSREL